MLKGSKKSQSMFFVYLYLSDHLRHYLESGWLSIFAEIR